MMQVGTRVECAWFHQRWKLNYDRLLSGFAFNLKLRPYTWVTHSIGDLALNTWSEATTLLSQDRDGGIPKVIANKVAVLSTGEWLMPFWREQQNAVGDLQCERDVETGVSGCPGNKPQMCMTGAKESAGVLVSKDEGMTWRSYGILVHMNTTLIEGSVAQLNNGTVLMVFRTTVGCLYQSTSNDKGRTWGNTRPMPIPNPNSKVGCRNFKGPRVESACDGFLFLY
jgi:predicted neuraminidase